MTAEASPKLLFLILLFLFHGVSLLGLEWLHLPFHMAAFGSRESASLSKNGHGATERQPLDVKVGHYQRHTNAFLYTAR